LATSATITAIGYLVADPLFKPEENGKQPYARFRVLHNPFGKKADGVSDLDPIAINFSFFGKQALTANQYCKKGTQVQVVGRVTSNSIALDKDGNPAKTKAGEYISNLDATAMDLLLLGSKDGSHTNGSTSGSRVAVAAGAASTSENLELEGPF
jgi:single-stranded DNA-binding protein